MGNPAGVRRDFDALEKRRMKAARLLERGLSEAEVARRVGVHRQSVNRWARALEDEGRAGLKKTGRAGRRPQLDPTQLRELERALKRGPEAYGYDTALWTLPRIAALIEERFGVAYHPGHVWRVLRALGWSCQRPTGKALERDEAAIRRWQRERWPVLKKRRRTRPYDRLRRRVGAEREAPSLPQLGAAGAHPGAAISLQLAHAPGHRRYHLVAVLLPALPRHRPGTASGGVSHPPPTPDSGQAAGDLGRPRGTPPSRAALRRRPRGHIVLERLPAYAPELNPAEYIWGHWKQHELPNLCAKDFAQLSHRARCARRRMQRRPTLVTAFWKQAELF